MIFRETPLAGLLEVRPDRSSDSRGAFFRVFCEAEFAPLGFRPVQISVSENARRHTLRGMHWQAAPHEERKLVRCIRGAVHDVAVDLRSGAHHAVVLSAEAGNALFIPSGFAHGFLTLTDDAALEYMMDVPFAPGFGRGARWNDKRFRIAWPAEPAVISERDATWADWDG